MNSKFLIKGIIGLIYVVLIGTPLFYTKEGIYPYILSKTLFFQATVELLFFAWLLLIFFDTHFRPKYTLLLKALFVFLGAILLSSLFGVDFYRSFWSTYERMFGIFTILHLAALAVVISSLITEIPWRKLLYVSLGTCFIVDILALLQIGIKNLLLVEPVDRPGATFGNPTFFAGYLLFHIFIAFYFLIDQYRSRTLKGKGFTVVPYFFFVGSLLFNVAALFFTETRGDILGLITGVFTLLVLFFLKPPDFGTLLQRRSLYLGLIVFMVSFGMLFWLTKSSVVWSSLPGISRFQNISLSSLGLEPRLVAIRSAWYGFLDRPIVGWGWENFNAVYNKYYDPHTLELNYQETRFDKPHNFFMEDLATGGLLLTLAHVALLVLLIAEAYKLKEKLLGNIIIASTAAYFVRSLFIFDTIGPALMLYVFLGFVDGWRRTDAGSEKSSPDKKRGEHSNDAGNQISVPFVPASLFLACSLFIVYELTIPTARASSAEFHAFTDLAHGQPLQAIEGFTTTLRFRSPYRWNFARDFAVAISEAYFYNSGVIPKDAALQAVREMEAVVKDHPNDAYNHYALVTMYNEISDIDPSRFLHLAEKEAARALELSPDRQEVYFSLAKTKTLRKDYPAALEVLKKALALDAKVPDAHFYYGVVAYAAGDSTTGYQELKTAIAMGREWKNFYEPRTAADFFADSGHLEEAIELYHKALSLDQNEIETKIKLGAAYFYAGQYDLAKKYLQEASEKFNFKQSSSYPGMKPILDKLGVYQ